MEMFAFLLFVGGAVGMEAAGGTWLQVAFWPFYAGKKLGQWAATPAPREEPTNE